MYDYRITKQLADNRHQELVAEAYRTVKAVRGPKQARRAWFQLGFRRTHRLAIAR